MKRAIESRERRGIFKGYFFTNSKGGMMRYKDLEIDILDRIARTQQDHPELIRPGLDVHEEYGLSRSFRRGFTWKHRIGEQMMEISIGIIVGGRWI